MSRRLHVGPDTQQAPRHTASIVQPGRLMREAKRAGHAGRRQGEMEQRPSRPSPSPRARFHKEATTTREPTPGPKLARRRGASLKAGPAEIPRAGDPAPGAMGPRAPHHAARLDFKKEGRTFTRLARLTTSSKACARAAVVLQARSARPAVATALPGRPRSGPSCRGSADKAR